MDPCEKELLTALKNYKCTLGGGTEWSMAQPNQVGSLEAINPPMQSCTNNIYLKGDSLGVPHYIIVLGDSLGVPLLYNITSLFLFRRKPLGVPLLYKITSFFLEESLGVPLLNNITSLFLI